MASPQQASEKQRLMVVTPDGASLDIELGTSAPPQSPPVDTTTASFNSFQLMLLALMVAQNAGVVLATRYSHTSVVESHKKYYPTNLVLAIEVAKLCLCVLIVGFQRVTKSMTGPLTKHHAPRILLSLPLACSRALFTLLLSLRYSLPIVPIALLYLVQNNILYIALANLPAPLFQLCYQTKLVTTALFSVFMIKERSYTKTQWMALVTLSFGVFLAVVGESNSKAKRNENESMMLGLGAVFTATLTSAIAGVCYEKVLQSPNTSIPPSVWTRNFQLSFFSLLPSLFLLRLPLFKNFTTIVYVILLLQAFGGLLVGLIVKHLNNVIKGLTGAVSLVVGTLVSSVVFGGTIDSSFVIGAVIIFTSVRVFTNSNTKTTTKQETGKHT